MVLQNAFCRGNGVTFPWIQLDRRPKGLCHSLKCRFGDVMRVDPFQPVDMQRDPAMGAESLEELADQLGIEAADLRRRERHVPHQERST